MKWKQDSDILTFIDEHQIKFKMPVFFDLNSVHPDTLKLAEYFLLYPLKKDMLDDYEFTRKSTGDKIGLSFSGGVDSASVLVLYDDNPDLILFHHERSWMPLRMLKQKSNHVMIKKIEDLSEREIHIVGSDMEKIRDPNGHLSDLQYFVSMILSSDILGIKYLSCGSMFDGRKQKVPWDAKSKNSTPDYVAYWNKVRPILKRAGFDFFYPVSGCSEVVTNNIVKNSIYNGFTFSCVRSPEPFNSCGNCVKCFRKNLINGKMIDNAVARNNIKDEKIHLKQLPVIVYANNKYGFKISDLKEFEQYNMDHLEKYYEPDLEFIPEELREDFKNRLSRSLGKEWKDITFK